MSDLRWTPTRSSGAAARSGTGALDFGRASEVARRKVRAALFDDVPTPTLGRFVLLGTLGEGGMGIVYAAYDRELERKVAVKVIRRAMADAESRTRFVREARAMARLAHPNVVVVFEVGQVGDDLFVAMEFVPGQTLDEWQRAVGRTSAEILVAYEQAARGLDAAHRVGLIHRDFKPANVMVGEDGRVRVLDFGLAIRASEDHAPPTLPVVSSSATLSEAAARGPEPRLSRRSTIAGTPRYMAPEQRAGRATDARSDQFAFCVALHEALWGHPFAPDPAVSKGRGARGGRELPAVRSLLRRGLAERPEDRFASMSELIAELQRATQRRGRARGWMMGLGGIAALGTVWTVFGASPEETCQPRPEALQGIWDEPTRQVVREAFTKTGRGNAVAMFDRVAEVLDAHADQWLDTQVESCRATRLWGTQSERLLDLRGACLARRLAELEGLSAALQAADAELVDQAIKGALALTPISSCDEAEVMRSSVASRGSAEHEALQRELARAASMAKVGRVASARSVVERVRERAEQLDDKGALAAANYRLAEMMDQDETQRAEALLRDTLTLAATAGDDALVASIWIELMSVVGSLGRRLDEAMSYRLAAETAVARDGSRARKGELELETGRLLHDSARYDQAETHYAAALVEFEAVGDRGALASLYSHQGELALTLGRSAEARDAFAKALAMAETLYGPQHDDVAVYQGNLAVALQELGRLDEALEAYARTFELVQSIHGPDSTRAAKALANLGSAHAQSGRLDEAQVAFERALSILQQSHGETHPLLVNVWSGLGGIALVRGDFQSARVWYERSLAIERQLYSGPHPNLASSLYSLGDVLRNLGAFDEARAMLTESLRMFEATLPSGHPQLSYPLHGLGKLELETGHAQHAIEPLTRALDLVPDEVPLDAALVEYDLARALWTTPSGRARARQLLLHARETLRAHPGAYDTTLGKIEDWLTAHG